MFGLFQGNTGPPGLVSREIVSTHDDHVVIREVWDTTVIGCPVVTLDPRITRVELEIWEKTGN